MDELLRDAVCTFGGHGPLPASAARGRPHVKKAPAPEAAGQAEGVPEEAVIDEDVASAAALSGESGKAQNSGMGLLFEPLEGTGLALTLGGTGLQLLEGTHRFLGPMLMGRRLLRRLQILAPVAGVLSSSQSIALRAVGPRVPEDGQEEDASISHPFLLLEKAPSEVPTSIHGGVFSSELAGDAAAAAAEELDALEFEINCRDGEMSELKQMSFSRERQEGVEVVIGILQDIEKSLVALGPTAPPEKGAGSGGTEDELVGQRWWLSQRAQHLLRVALKLR